MGAGEFPGYGYAALSRDGKRLAIADIGSLRLLDAETGQQRYAIAVAGVSHGLSRRAPTFSADGRTVGVPSFNGVALFDIPTGRRVQHEDNTPVGRLTAAAWSPGADAVLTAHEDGELRVWDSATGALTWRQMANPAQSGSAIPFVAFSPDGRRVVAAGAGAELWNGALTVYEVGRAIPIRRVEMAPILYGALSPDGRVAVVGTWGGTGHRLNAVDIATGKIRYEIPAIERNRSDEVQRVAFSADSATLALSTKKGEVALLDSATGVERGRFVADYRTPAEAEARKRGQFEVFAGAFSASCDTFVASSYDFAHPKSLHIWDTATGAVRCEIHYPHHAACLVAVSPDGRTVALSDVREPYLHGPIRLFDADSGDQIITLECGENGASVLAFSPDGTELLAGFHRGTAKIWDVRR